MEHLNDQQLLEALRSQHEEALGVLFLRYHDDLYRYGLKISSDKMIVEDVIQEIFMKILKKVDSLYSIKNFRAYLFTVYRRDLTNKMAQTPKYDFVTDLHTSKTDVLFYEDDVDYEGPYQQEHKQKLTAALNQLPWRQKEAILLRYYNNLSTNEISEIMAITNQTVLNTIYKGLKKLKKITVQKEYVGVISFLLIWFNQLFLKLGAVV